MLARLRTYLSLLRRTDERLEHVQLALGRIERRQVAGRPVATLREAEFQVHSQWGEDGIIQHLVSVVPIERRVFVEFGVEDYTESNTRFLLQHENWGGLVLDGSPENIAAIRRDPIYWRHNLKAQAAFVDRDNINALIAENGIEGDIGLLSIDIDGNDYWVWEAIRSVAPRIVVVEYNSLFGPRAPVSIPYDPRFARTQAHYSNLYWGASLAALARLGKRKGYALVGSNSAGNNAFFVREEHAAGLPASTAEAAYVRAQFRESRGSSGELTFLDHAAALALVGHMPVVDVDTMQTVRLSDAVGRGA
jgi:hypothetical protein